MPDLGLKTLRGLFAILLLVFFAGSLPLSFGQKAEAKTKKFVRKVRSKKIVRKLKKRTVRKAKKKAKRIVRSKNKKTVRAKPAAKPAGKASSDNNQYQLPSRSGSVTQRYSIEEGLGGDEADNVISGLQSVGADEVSVDSSKNTVSITYNTSKLTSVGIVKKLKTMGFSARRLF